MTGRAKDAVSQVVVVGNASDTVAFFTFSEANWKNQQEESCFSAAIGGQKGSSDVQLLTGCRRLGVVLHAMAAGGRSLTLSLIRLAYTNPSLIGSRWLGGVWEPVAGERRLSKSPGQWEPGCENETTRGRSGVATKGACLVPKPKLLADGETEHGERRKHQQKNSNNFPDGRPRLTALPPRPRIAWSKGPLRLWAERLLR